MKVRCILRLLTLAPSLSASCYHDPITFSLRTAEREGSPSRSLTLQARFWKGYLWTSPTSVSQKVFRSLDIFLLASKFELNLRGWAGALRDATPKLVVFPPVFIFKVTLGSSARNFFLWHWKKILVCDYDQEKSLKCTISFIRLWGLLVLYFRMLDDIGKPESLFSRPCSISLWSQWPFCFQQAFSHSSPWQDELQSQHLHND